MLGDFLVAKVALSNAAYSYDVEYSYSVPQQFREKLTDGARVLVPFGKANRKRIGFVTRTYEQDIHNPDLKPVLKLIDEQSLVGDELMRLIFWLKENTFCTFYEAFKTVVPTGFSYQFRQHYALVNGEYPPLSEEESAAVETLRNCPTPKEADAFLDLRMNPQKKELVRSLLEKGVIEELDSLKRRVGDSTIRMIRLSEAYCTGMADKKLTPKQRLVVELLEDCQTASAKEAMYMTGVTAAIIRNLVKAKVLEEYECETLRTVCDEPAEQEMPPVLTEEQQQAFEGISRLIDDKKPAGALLFGVTGSGKTAVFIRLIAHTIKQGRAALLLVPEIALTPQMVGKFRRIFGQTVAVIHSALSLGQRVDEFKRIKNGDARIVIGTRSAVFAPAENIGLVIMDEEGEHTYKSEASPRYHARDAARFRCGFHNALLLMASATPSIESFYYAQKGRYSLFELKERYAGASLPQVVIADMQTETEEGNTGLFSRVMLDQITATLARREQVILLLNRRGFSTHVSCMDCKKHEECPNCNILLTYHKKNNRLMCHYCGYSRSYTGKCTACGSTHLRITGTGTQRVEDEIAKNFPDARLLRMDADTAYSRYAYEKSFSAFARGEYDILLGTQMIAKGLDFPNVTLVGVISLDKALFTGDFRSYERTFSLITQVVGRGGRGEKAGTAVLQTFVPEHYVIELAAQQDYRGFYESEIALRHTLIYPPFCDICVVGFSAVIEADSNRASRAFVELIRGYLQENEVKFPMRVLGPAPNTLGRINNRYRHRIIIKTRNTRDFREMMSLLLKKTARAKEFVNVRVFADINGDIGL